MKHAEDSGRSDLFRSRLQSKGLQGIRGARIANSRRLYFTSVSGVTPIEANALQRP
jgi:hypothetical protein